MLALLLIPTRAVSQQSERSFASGYAGTLSLDPRLLAGTYFRSPKVRALIGEMEDGPATRSEVATALRGTGFTIAELERVKLLRRDKDRFFIGFNYFTARDQARIQSVAHDLVPSLVTAYLKEKPRFDRLAATYGVPTVSTSKLLFVLIAGFSLNWDGLRLTRELDHRTPVIVEGPGFRYSFWAAERTPARDRHGFYWGSSTFPGAGIDLPVPTDFAFSSFGDPYSDPRMNFPDLLLMPAGDMQPAVRHAAERVGLVDDSLLGHRFTGVLGTARGRVLARMLFALRRRTISTAALARLAGDSATGVACLNLLETIGYVSRDGMGSWSLRVPVFDRGDSAMVDTVLGLSRSILRAWLVREYPVIERRLSNLTAARQGVPFASLLTQIWHELFGLANRDLVRSGLLFDPRGPNVRYPGSFPALWRRSLYDLHPG